MRYFALLAATAFIACAPPALAAGAGAASAAGESSAVDPERLALATQLLDSMHLERLLNGVLEGMLKSMPMGDDADKANRLRSSMEVGFRAIMPDIKHAQSAVYARVFTAQELRDATAFYSSPSGQSFLAKAPEAATQGIATMWPLMPKMVDAMQADYCSHVKCGQPEEKMFAEMREAYAKMGAQQRPRSN
jgi:hypothetical protein